MAQDQGQSAAALAWYDRSHEWALEAGDPNMAATTLSMKAHMAWSGGRGARCVRLAEAARWSAPGTSLGVQGMAAQMAARGHALGGDADNAQRLLDEAQTLINQAAEHPEDEPPWMYFYGEIRFTLQRGMAALQLRHWQTAIGRPHSWNELHTTAAVLLRRGAREGHQLVAALREQDIPSKMSSSAYRFHSRT